jgi:hypothetical protein
MRDAPAKGVPPSYQSILFPNIPRINSPSYIPCLAGGAPTAWDSPISKDGDANTIVRPFYCDQPRYPESCVYSTRARLLELSVIDRVRFRRLRLWLFLGSRREGAECSPIVHDGRRHAFCAASDGALNVNPIVQESPLPSTSGDAFHRSAEVPVVPQPEDGRQIESEQDPKDGGFWGVMLNEPVTDALLRQRGSRGYPSQRSVLDRG